MKSYVNTKIEDYVEDDSEIFFEYDPLDEHEYPHEERVPADWYYAMIVDVKKSSTAKYHEAVDVFYKLLPKHIPRAWNEGKIDAYTFYYVKQRYSKGSESERKFKKALFHQGVSRQFRRENLVGHRTGVKIEYGDDPSMGSVVDYQETNIDKSWFLDDLPEETESE